MPAPCFSGWPLAIAAWIHAHRVLDGAHDAQQHAGIIAQVGVRVPLVVRLEGTNVEAGKDILRSSGVDVITASDLDDAAKKAVAAIKA